MIKKIVLAITFILLLVGLATLIYFYTLYRQSYVGDKEVQTPRPTFVKPTYFKLGKIEIAVNLLGYAGPGHDGTTLTDQ